MKEIRAPTTLIHKYYKKGGGYYQTKKHCVYCNGCDRKSINQFNRQTDRRFNYLNSINDYRFNRWFSYFCYMAEKHQNRQWKAVK